MTEEIKLGSYVYYVTDVFNIESGTINRVIREEKIIGDKVHDQILKMFIDDYEIKGKVFKDVLSATREAVELLIRDNKELRAKIRS